MTTLSSDPINNSPFLNPPETLLREISDAQAIVKFQHDRIAVLKAELDQHLHLGTIDKNFSHEGIAASRCTRQGRWSYSEFCDELAKDLKGKLDNQMQLEREDGIAVQSPETFYWMVKTND